MKKRLAFIGLAVALACVALAATSQAQTTTDRPLFSLTRLSLAAGASYDWFGKAGDQPLPLFKKEWKVGVFGAYNLTPHLSLVASTDYGLDNKWTESKVGLRLRVFQGSK